MKIGFATEMVYTTEKRWGNRKYKMLAELGFECLDYQMVNTESLLYTMSEAELAEYAAKEKALANEAGIEIFQAHGPWRWPPNDYTAEGRAERMEKMKRSILVASLLGCKNWIVHPIMPFGTEDIGTGNEQATWDMNAEFMSELLRTAKELGVTICYENMPMPKFSLATPERILDFVRLMNDDSFKICLDTGHVAVFKELSLGDEVRRLGGQIAALHVHDNNGSRDQHCFPYFGRIDWADFVKALRETDYVGAFSIESVVPVKIPSPIYEEICRTLRNIAFSIVNEQI